MTSPLNVCVIGAGAAGLTAIKACLENNLSVTCYECSSSIGGIWSTDVTKYTITNSSKELSAFSDFSPPSEYPAYMNQVQVNSYLKEYAKHFHLDEYIKFNHRVLRVKQVLHSTGDEKWQVHVQSNDTTDESSRLLHYDAVMLCTGTSSEPCIPQINGMKDKFTGSIVHSSNLYSESTDFQINSNDKVIVMGGGNSAGDAAVFAADRTSEPVIMLNKIIPWILPRRGPFGRPLDETLYRRSLRAQLNLIPSYSLTNYLLELLFSTIYFDHKTYCGGMRPSHGLFDDQCMINDILPYKMLTGNVKILQISSAVQFDERCVHVILHDGKKMSVPCDKVIMATGYKNSLKSKDIVGQLLNDLQVDREMNDEQLNRFTSRDKDDEKVNYPLFKHMFIPEYGHSFAMIGSITPLGPVFPLVEMQCRWAAALIATRGKGNESVEGLPCIDRMKKIIAQDLSKQPQATSKPNLVDWLSYMDDIAAKISATPSFLPLLMRDPVAWYHTYFSPAYPYQFRLNSPPKGGHYLCGKSDSESDHCSASHHDDEANCNWSLVKRSDQVKSMDDSNGNEVTKQTTQSNGSCRCVGQVNQVSRRTLITAVNRMQDAFKCH